VSSLLHIGVSASVRHSSAKATTNSRQKSGMSGTTLPQTEWKAGERRQDTSPTISWAAWKGPYPSAGVVTGVVKRLAGRRALAFVL
jgi:hypothetical protein